MSSVTENTNSNPPFARGLLLFLTSVAAKCVPHHQAPNSQDPTSPAFYLNNNIPHYYFLVSAISINKNVFGQLPYVCNVTHLLEGMQQIFSIYI